MYIYSLPRLELLQRVARHNYATRESLSPLSTHALTGSVAGVASMDRTGDFVDTPTSLDVQLWTVFATTLRPGPPMLELFQPKWFPFHPGAVGAGAFTAISGWWNSKAGAVTPGAQLDEVIAGPKRPDVPRLGQAGVRRVPAGGQELARLKAEQDAALAAGAAGGGGAAGKAQDGYGSYFTGAYASVSKAASSTANQAARNLDLAQQRGDLINSLEQGMSNLERNASKFSNNLKQQALKNAVKSKFSGYL